MSNIIIQQSLSGLGENATAETWAQYQARMAAKATAIDKAIDTARTTGPVPVGVLGAAGLVGAVAIKGPARYVSGAVGLGALVVAYFIHLDRRNLKSSFPDAPWA